MTAIISLAKLDFLTIKPYAKNLAIMVMIMVVFSLSPGLSSSGMGLSGAYAAVIASYPFSIGEKSHLDVLYSILPVRRSNVVLGRYLFAFIIQIIFPAILILGNLIYSLISGSFAGFEDAAIISLSSLLISSFIIATQMPIYFKFGYNKSKVMAYLPTFIIIFVVVGSMGIIKNVGGIDSIVSFLFSLPNSVVVLAIVMFCIVAQTISIMLSVKFYGKRDL